MCNYVSKCSSFNYVSKTTFYNNYITVTVILKELNISAENRQHRN